MKQKKENGNPHKDGLPFGFTKKDGFVIGLKNLTSRFH